MAERYEERILFEYVYNLVSATNARSKAAAAVVDWLREEAEFDVNSPGMTASASGSLKDVSATLWSTIRSHLAERLEKLSSVEPSLFQRNLAELGRGLTLDELETAILGLAIRTDQSKRLESLCNALSRDTEMKSTQILSALLGASPTEIRRRINPRSRLCAYGVLSIDHTIFERVLGLRPLCSLVEALLPPNRGLKDIRRSLLGEPCATNLAFSDFDHIGQERDLMARILRGALRQGTRGINVLVYGPPGTGKTELCKVVTKHLNLSLYATGETDWTGVNPSSDQRIESFQLAQRLLARVGKAVLLFDEMEDMWNNRNPFAGPWETGPSKVFRNYPLDTGLALWHDATLKGVGKWKEHGNPGFFCLLFPVWDGPKAC